MPRCEVCWEEVDTTYTCKECEIKFCGECGDPKKRLCMYCLEEEEEKEEAEELGTVCEICGKEVDEVYECKECGFLFCSDCGDPRKKLCNFCLEEE
ncbi:MAG: hypothetical protein ACETVR_03390 [Candidatus Bathyarchaeia archaeon]